MVRCPIVLQVKSHAKLLHACKSCLEESRIWAAMCKLGVLTRLALAVDMCKSSKIIPPTAFSLSYFLSRVGQRIAEDLVGYNRF
jgi:hypothetical protein